MLATNTADGGNIVVSHESTSPRHGPTLHRWMGTGCVTHTAASDALGQPPDRLQLLVLAHALSFNSAALVAGELKSWRFLANSGAALMTL